MGKWFNADIVALSVPVTCAVVAFSSMIGRAFLVDPEWSNGMQFYEKPEAEQAGKTYRNQYRQFFQSGKMSLFNNKIEINN
mmetsp:Transcript_26538/g.67534  ORF Transcript_26538/g.67534 Transcript_26538/m.67534 type:complete len:81 (+) Transcript_26538:137-379(+)|eukprot:CAMPEP_0202857498 /NCGR_PEP_ID=MMETSP1391-20130828/411_1 /ASSEMBLY_ACC=CAM_ASM_000867 /TAXON_ID=1034604 /ORGANISM="Chlamydomonas leiostraca, Strain SAG 11-49" /LENGTH=80 /DNA_ID=CAMNT_0049536303 /DNA_START=107 /DNA_END=349 /DNA_ORIENTATION=+